MFYSQTLTATDRTREIDTLVATPPIDFEGALLPADVGKDGSVAAHPQCEETVLLPFVKDVGDDDLHRRVVWMEYALTKLYNAVQDSHFNLKVFIRKQLWDRDPNIGFSQTQDWDDESSANTVDPIASPLRPHKRPRTDENVTV